MAHGSTHLQARGSPSSGHGWSAALYRGTILGLVIALHLGLLGLLFGPVTPRGPASGHEPGHDDALRVRLVAEVAKPGRATFLSRHPSTARQVPRRVAVAIAATTDTAAEKPALTAAPVEAPAMAGNYHSPLLEDRAGMATTSAVPRLPGTDVAHVRGISLHDRPSLQQVVRVMTTASRCKYTRMKMERSANQFVTRQLMDRALEADGCGPQVPHTADDHTVEAISHQAIFGD